MIDNSMIFGLTDDEVEERKRNGLGNTVNRVSTKSYKHIFIENIFSLFNFINLIIAIILLYVGSIKNCLFMLVVVCNTFIGIIQEIRSKRVIDKLSIINQSTVAVIRAGKKENIDVNEIVMDDVVELSSGCQVSNDCMVIDGSCEVNESLITGESDSIFKGENSGLLSGSYIVSGKCLCKVTGVGKNNYADSILSQIKYVKKTNSEIVKVIKRIIVVISICIIPFSVLLFYNQYTLTNGDFTEAVINSAAAIIGMIPEGLVLLISTVFAIGVIRLSKRKVLSQDLYSLEALARTDVLCLDKTGTITTGKMRLEKLVPAKNIDITKLENAVKTIAALSDDSNSTMTAIKERFCGSVNCKVIKTIPFSSDRKWSAVCTEEYGTYEMGAAEMLFKTGCDFSAIQCDDREKCRIIAVAHSEQPVGEKGLHEDLQLLGFILLSEEIRDSISDTFNFFNEQGVQIKIISGDNPVTVQKLCGNVFPQQSVKCIDMSKVADNEIEGIVEENSIFGRVTPNQKKLIISALKNKGHTVGMVGDGVNDVLALKESDCSIGLANGSEAARNVSQLVLLDSDFRSLPCIVAEGRRSINNLQNSSSLFLAKTFFSAVMTLIFMFINFPYPFEPIQMSLISSLTIGIPSFILSFERNSSPIRGKFILNVIRKTIPAAFSNIFSVMAVVLFGEMIDLNDAQISTICVLVLAVTGILLVIYTYKPLTPLRTTIIGVSIFGFLLAFIVFNGFFGLTSVFDVIAIYMVLFGCAAGCIFILFAWLFSSATSKSERS